MRRATGVGFWTSVLAMGWVALFHGPATASPATPIVSVSPNELTPYTSGGCYHPRKYSCYKVFGTADPGAKVIITVTSEASPGLSVTATSFAAEVDDPGAGIKAGDWKASPNVTDLGAHSTEPSALTFTVVARDAAGNSSAPAVATATKFATTPGDPKGPETRADKWPPSLWCRTGLTCFSCFLSSCTGQAAIQGSVEDDSEGAFGLASEVADVIITITRQPEGTVVKELHPFVRRGPQAFYGAAISIGDFETNTTYRVDVQAVDAFGQKGNVVSSAFRVMPL